MAAWMARGERGAGAYRRRRPLPAVAIIVVLLISSTVVWITLLGGSNGDVAMQCNSPSSSNGSASAARSGRPLARDALDGVPPVPANQVQVTVLNGAGQRGAASLVTVTLQQLGFTQVAQPSNDPLYPDQNLQCRGQIRFGRGGAAAARTLSIIEPCVQLVRDGRQDASVDLAIGSKFEDLEPSAASRQLLHELNQLGTAQPPERGGQQAEQGRDVNLDQDLVREARDVQC
ncbi:MAG: envelope integrity protein Cei [Sciscionella sp.]